MSTNRLIGYARSDNAVQLEGQLLALNRAGCDLLLIDRVGQIGSGQGWAMVEALAQSGDRLVVRDIKAVVHSQRELYDLIRKLQHRQIQFIALDDGIDTTVNDGHDLIQALAALDRLDEVADAKAATPAAARQSIPSKLLERADGDPGKKAGRPRTDPDKLAEARHLYEKEGRTAEQACQAVGISRRTFFNYLAQQRTGPDPASTPNNLDP